MKTLIFWLDAFRSDYISKKNTPFLYDLSKKYGVATIKPSFGFSQASWYTGVYPNKHGEFSTFNNGKEKISTWYLRLFPRKLRPFVFNLFRYLKGDDYISHFIDIREMGKFSLTRKRYYHHKNTLKVKTMFDYFKENKISYLMYYWPLIIENGKTRLTILTKGTDKSKINKSIKLIKSTNHDVYLFHITELDSYGHRYGPKSPEIKIKLREQDFLVEKLVREFNLEEDNIIIWSDHGMLEIKGIMDLEKILPKDKRYKRLIESTIVKLWFYDKEFKKIILNKLKKVKYGHILSNPEKKKFKINYEIDENFEEIFLVDPGYLICPNVFQNKPIKGMHGYDCSKKGELAFLILNKKFKKHGNMVDILPTILQMLKLNHSNANLDGYPLSLDGHYIP